MRQEANQRSDLALRAFELAKLTSYIIDPR